MKPSSLPFTKDVNGLQNNDVTHISQDIAKTVISWNLEQLFISSQEKNLTLGLNRKMQHSLQMSPVTVP